MHGDDLHAKLEERKAAVQLNVTRLAMRQRVSSRPACSTSLTVRFWRNTAIEPLVLPVAYYLGLDGIELEPILTGYDDSLAFGDLTSASSEVEVVVVEAERYSVFGIDFDDWLNQRCDWLASASGNAVISVVVRDSEVSPLSLRVGGEEVWADEVSGCVSATELQSTGSLLTALGFCVLARELGLVWIPAARGDLVKLIAVDLDNTLHDGVFGEIGQQVRVTAEHLALQSELLHAKARGVLLAAVSKNTNQDVMQLLSEHPDYLLRPDDFVAIEASWSPKALAIGRVVEATRVADEAVIFVDDNYSELQQVKAVRPTVRLVSAGTGPADALTMINYVPGYRTFRSDNLGEVRRTDIVSNEARMALIDEGLAEYLESARPRIHFHVGSNDLADRLADLCARSNQFNVTLRRSSVEMFRMGACDKEGKFDHWFAVGAKVSDRFSDSGVVAGALAELSDDGLVVAELFMSCRALGRGLEDAILCGMLERVARFAKVQSLQLPWQRGPRNVPAIDWLSTFVDIGEADSGQIELSVDLLSSRSRPKKGVLTSDERIR